MLLALPALLMGLSSLVAAQAEPTCTQWRQCQQLALDAAAREEFETFHSLAWRAVQTGAPNDPNLMFMLARAQVLSGRPDDSLVMLGRLADRGFPHPEVEALDDFRRVREMPGWPNLLEKMYRIASAPPSPVPPSRAAAPTAPVVTFPKPSAAPTVAPARKGPTPPALPAASSSAAEPAEISPMVVPFALVVPVPAAVAGPVAMGYDKVSERFIIADDPSGTLKVVSELSGRSVDLVGPGLGGGYRITALVIDSKRGDLWVAGNRMGDGPESIVQRLQLISGRLLYNVPSAKDLGATRFASVALSAANVFVLDAEGGRIFELDGAARALRLRTTVSQHNLTSLTLASETVAYVAHAGGILRVDLATKRSESVVGPSGIALDGIEWLGYFGNSLLAVRRGPDGAMTAMRLRFDRRGRAVTAADTFGAAAATAGAVLGDTFLYIASLPEGSAVARVDLRAGSQKSQTPKPRKRPFEAPISGKWDDATRTFDGVWSDGKSKGGSISLRLREP